MTTMKWMTSSVLALVGAVVIYYFKQDFEGAMFCLLSAILFAIWENTRRVRERND